MKKIIKILERPLAVLPAVFVISIIAGYFIYQNTGLPPVIDKNSLDGDTFSSGNQKEGEEIDLAFLKSGKVEKVFVKTGDMAKKGELLANLDYSDVKGALDIARANYEKIVNGTASPDIKVARTATVAAQTALDQIKTQQDLLVANAYKNLLNTGLSAVPETISSTETPPAISGMYSKGKEGRILLTVSSSGADGEYFVASGLADAVGKVSNTVPQPIGDTGLFIKFPSITSNTNWIIDIPNKQSSQYLQVYNSYEAALSARDQSVANAEAALDQANSILAQKLAEARPEDVAAALGAVQVAESAYNNAFIYAPADGIITAVNISEGEIAGANQKAIILITRISK